MITANIVTYLRETDNPPTDAAERRRWFEGEDALSFLASTTTAVIPIYISTNSFFLCTAFVPSTRFRDEYPSQMLDWCFNPDSQWSWGYQLRGRGRGRVPKPFVHGPLDATSGRFYEGGTPLLYRRWFDGLPTAERTYLELDQRIAQICDLHWVAARSGWCRIDQHGDVQNVLTIARDDDRILCTASSDFLDFYGFVTGQQLVRVFDITRVERGFGGWGGEHRSIHRGDLVARGQLTGTGGYWRGAQHVRRTDTDERLTKMLLGEPLDAKQYESFIVYDWKNNRVCEWSSDPSQLGNFFKQNDLPFELSPAFFRPDVLLRYKSDPDKYRLSPHSISCRGAWYLKHYGVNDAHQVFSYIGYLSALPHSEQLYWKSFNEPPKAGLPELEVRRNFLGQWVSAEDPLENLKLVLRQIPSAKQGGRAQRIWTLGKELDSALDSLHPLYTESSKEWRDAILALNQVIVEGLQTKPLRKLAQHLACNDPTLRSLGLLRAVLSARTIDESLIEDVYGPLRDLQNARSQGIAHRGSGSQVRSTLREDYHARLLSLHQAMGSLADLIRQGVFDIP